MNNYLDVENLIKSRRDTKNFLSKKISKKNISKILEMGIWSPNHRMTEPWTFVLTSALKARPIDVKPLIWTLKDRIVNACYAVLATIKRLNLAGRGNTWWKS